MVTREDWETEVQHFEADWWGDCANTYGEETKQIAYAKVMQLDPGRWRGGDHWPKWDFGDANVIDIGGGPTSMLLKSTFGTGMVVDPCAYPEWTKDRYEAHGVEVNRVPAEDFLAKANADEFDVALMYNVLQHTIDPDTILLGLARVAKRVHLFEWVDMAPSPGHPHMLDADHMQELLPLGQTRHVFMDDQYREVNRQRSVQHGWGGVFG